MTGERGGTRALSWVGVGKVLRSRSCLEQQLLSCSLYHSCLAVMSSSRPVIGMSVATPVALSVGNFAKADGRHSMTLQIPHGSALAGIRRMAVVHASDT